MQLEIISRYPDATPKTVPLLFVHGAFACARIWDVYFLPYFARKGYQAHALSLRGHGASAGREQLSGWSLADYVADLTQAVAGLERAPVLIGHSMGGMVIQKYLELQRPAGVVLMNSLPPQGSLPSLWGMLVSNPLLVYRLALIQIFGDAFATPDVMRQALFSDSLSEAQLRAFYPLLHRESQRVSLDLLGLDPLRLDRRPDIPLLVMGAGRDAFFSAGLVRDTARHYQAQCVIFPKMPHAMMLEDNWQQPAEYLLHWLNRCFAV